jgi:hypothetical protein
MKKYLIKVQWNSYEFSEGVYELKHKSIEDFIEELFDKRYFVKISYWLLEKETIITSEAVFLKRREEILQKIQKLKMESKPVNW